MSYIAIHIKLDPMTLEYSEFLFALLDIYEFEGIHEKEDGIITYKAMDDYSSETLEQIQTSLKDLHCEMAWKTEEIPDQNWNQLWESNYEPVIIADQLVVRAPFHEKFDHIRRTITIEPRMAFGTGHHQTTHLMLEHMLSLDFKRKKVLDMGCGTGILSILASLLGSDEVIAIDSDGWACQNTQENAEKNQAHNLRVIQGDFNVIPDDFYDIILANIDRNTILHQLNAYRLHTRTKSLLILSGMLTEDYDTMYEETTKESFHLLESKTLDVWILMMFERK